MLILPFRPSVAEYDFSCPINDTPYIFDVRWNARDSVDPETGEEKGAWYFTLAEIDGSVIVANMKVVVGTYLGRRSTHALFSRGAIAVIDTSGEYRDPGFDDMGEGQRVEVRYYTSEDIAAEIFGD